MNDTDAATQREAYLQRLDAAIARLPHGVAAEIRAGVAEELAGLDEEALTARIGDLGDPVDIAREARQELPAEDVPLVPALPISVAQTKPPATETRGFAIIAALTLSFGGIVLLGVGWVIGAVLVCLSGLWHPWEKAVAILVPLAGAIVLGLVSSTFWVSGDVTAVVSEGSGSQIPEAVNPLIPAVYDIVMLAVAAIALLLIPASGLWLLWRLRGRTGRVAR